VFLFESSKSKSLIFSTAKTRAIYNQFGEEGLKGGVPDKGWCI